MNYSDIRAKARQALTGKWGKAAVIMLINMAIIYAAQLVSSIVGIASIAIVVCTTPIQFGLFDTFLKIRRNQDVDYADFLKIGFKNFGRSWAIVGNALLKIWYCIVIYLVTIVFLFITMFIFFLAVEEESVGMMIFGIFGLIISIIGLYASVIFMYVKNLNYVLAQYIAIDNPEMSPKAAVEKSAELMNGYKGKFFILSLTFYGWQILNALTLGIGSLWLTPYISVAQIVFYEELLEKNKTVEVVAENN